MSPKVLFCFHWLFVVCLLLSLLTGLTIATDQPGSVIFGLRDYLPDGDVFFWHLLSASLLVGLFFGYLFWQVTSGGIKRLYGVFNCTRTTSRVRISHRLSYSFLCTLFIGSVLTGILLYVGILADIPVKSAHFILACGYPAFLIAHLIFHYQKGKLPQLLRIFTWRSGYTYVASSLGVAALFSAVIGITLFWNYRVLSVPLIQQEIVIDGVFDDEGWQHSKPVEVLTQQGANFENGETPVVLRAARTDTHVYFALSWKDPTRSQKHLPLIKTQSGWKALQTDFMRANEDVYYEDKLALMLVRGNPFAALTSIHLGKHPIKGQPSSFGERGLHYTSGEHLDIWHWQSVRSNQHRQADDSYFGPPLNAPPLTPRNFNWDGTSTHERYTGGYRKDPPTTWSGYSMNWEVFETGQIQPRRLPKESDDLGDLGNVSLDPNQSDGGKWWFEWDDTEPYLIENDHFSPGTVLPGVLLKEPRTGDRADIEAYGVWKEGYWYLEMARPLATDSKYDVEVAEGTYIWVAAFDHTQTRHTRHMIPLRLRFDSK